MNYPISLYTGVMIVAIVVLILLLAYRILNKSKKEEADSKTLPESPVEDLRPMAGMTRVLPIGMLIAKSGCNRGMVYAIEPTGLKIGRDKEKNHVVVPNPVVSREHAWIGLCDGKVVIKDCNSSNGTYINSLDTPRIETRELKDGDIIYLGKTGAESFKFKTA